MRGALRRWRPSCGLLWPVARPVRYTATVTTPTSQPNATTNVREAARGAVARVNVCLPATVVGYDETTQLASVRVVPCFRRRNPANGGAVECYAPPDVHGVPVAFPGGGDFSITWPLAAGDSGHIVVSDRSMDEWKATAEARTEPQDIRRHDLSDAIFVPGVRSPSAPLQGDAVQSDGMVVSGPIVVLRSDDVRLGSKTAAQAVALAPPVEADLGTLKSALAAAGVAAVAAAVPGDGGTAAFTAFNLSLGGALSGWPSSLGASKVVAE